MAPREALSEISSQRKNALGSNPELSYGITQEFFDGQRLGRPPASPSPVAFYAMAFPDGQKDKLRDACRGATRTNCDTQPPDMPKSPQGEGKDKDKNPSSSEGNPDPASKDGPSGPCSFLQNLAKMTDEECIAYNKAKEQELQEKRKLDERFDLERQQKVDNLSGTGQFGYYALTAALLVGFTWLGAHFGPSLSPNMEFSSAKFLGGVVGFVLGALLGGLSHWTPGRAHAFVGNTILSPFALAAGAVSGVFDALTFGHSPFSSSKGDSFMGKTYNATKKIANAVALAGGITPGASALGVAPVGLASGLVSPTLALGAGAYGAGSALVQGTQAIVHKIRHDGTMSKLLAWHQEYDRIIGRPFNKVKAEQQINRLAKEGKLSWFVGEMNAYLKAKKEKKSLIQNKERLLQEIGLPQATTLPGEKIPGLTAQEAFFHINQEVAALRESLQLLESLKATHSAPPSKRWHPGSKAGVMIAKTATGEEIEKNMLEIPQDILPVIPEEALLRKIETEKSFPSQKGWIKNGQAVLPITALPGEPRPPNDLPEKIHDHVDIRLAPGTSIRSPREGTILYDAHDGEGYGHHRSMLYEDSQAYCVLIAAHLGNDSEAKDDPKAYGSYSRTRGSVGKQVPSGAVIGQSGNSGTAQDAPHLDYGLYRIPKKYNEQLKERGVNEAEYKKLLGRLENFRKEPDHDTQVKMGNEIYVALINTKTKSPRLQIKMRSYAVNPLDPKNWPEAHK
ncbi:MAG: peptidoglycan DD-metalloendopeptidase family protein [Elusimicrobia bacterium]|nr:peptidoglycan DD-metalloendopeptidase family protein [Elusimicrobiota bacterium]